MPVTGPFTRTESSPSGSYKSFFKQITSYRQGRPYSNRLPYSVRKTTVATLANAWGSEPSSADLYSSDLNSSPYYTDAVNGAYNKFRDEARQTASLGASIAERKQSVDMIAKRSSQIFRFARLLKSFRFLEAAKSLGISIDPKTVRKRKRVTTMTSRHGGRDYELVFKKRAKSFGDNFLEVHFGWEPLVKDIGDAMEILHKEVYPGNVIRVRGRKTTVVRPLPFTYGWLKAETQTSYTTRVQCIADVTVTDPNVFRLSQLGFVNPIAVMWELVPFSFVVDWFANVGDVLSAYTDFVGMALSQPFTTVFNITTDRYAYTGPDPITGQRLSAVYGTRQTVAVQRSAGISGPTLALKPPKWPSVTRGLTAVALLTQFLRK